MHSLRNTAVRYHLFNKLFRGYYSGGLYEPSYLESMKPQFPLYDTINIQLKGYDYPILENYQKFLHKLMKHIEINVEDCWAIPAQHLQIVTYKPKTDIIDADYKLKLYERNVQITDVSPLQLPIILRTIESSLPAGVTVDVQQHQEIDEEVRYVPDTELNTLKEQLEDLGGPSKKK